MKIFTLLFFAVCWSVAGQAQDRITGRSFATRSEVIAQHGMACTSQPLATQAALDILKAGGSAVDAAIAANAVPGLVEPVGNGICGEPLPNCWGAKTPKTLGIEARGGSPHKVSPKKF